MTDGLLGKWHYTDVENDIQQHALKSAANYSEKKPFLFLPDDRASQVLRHIGASAADISRLVGYNYQTVVGWFHRMNRLTRPTVAEALFPALCEAYVQFHGPSTIKYARSHQDYVKKGLPIDDGYRLAVEQHIAYLVCTGDPKTPEWSRQVAEQGHIAYKRAVIHFSAIFLADDELDAVALSCMGLLHRHRDVTERRAEDTLCSIMDALDWCFWADDNARCDYLAHLREDNALIPQAALIEQVSGIHYLAQKSDDDLISVRAYVDKLVTSRSKPGTPDHILSITPSYLENLSL